LVAQSRTLEQELGVDSEALLARYRRERDKRLRVDGVGQFLSVTGRFEHYRDDPWVDPAFTRRPLTDEVEVLVVGGGLGALQLGANLRKAGVQSIRFVERAGGFGGVWYWNRYPGAACDTQAILYLPMLEETGYMPRRRFSPQPEILEHFERIASKFDLHRDTCFQTNVTCMQWDAGASRWIVSTDRDDAIRARYVAVPSGPMDRPKLPGIPGIETFRGHSFHSSRWDYDYTGGSADGGMSKLGDKAVGIIGTGATAIQCVPYLAESAKHLFVFQRTPSSIDIRDNREHDADWRARLKVGWQQELLENFTAQVSGNLVEQDLIRDGWTSIMTNIKYLMEKKRERGESVAHPMLLMQLADYLKMNAIRDRVDETVRDPAVAEALKPWYNRFCKRPCFSDCYLPTFNRPNVTLVDTSGRGVERITENAIIVDGREYPIDCLIYSTGFENDAPFAKRIGCKVIGRDGVTLADKWTKGASTQHGFMTHGFPNFFIMSVTQTGLSLNFSHMISEQAKHIAHILGRASREAIDVIEVTREAEETWGGKIDRSAVSQEDFLRQCTPSYFNAEGDLTRMNRRNSPYGGGPLVFYKILENWRAKGTMPGLKLTRGGEIVSRGDLYESAPTTTRAAIERFVEVYNEPDSDIYPLYDDRVDWIEMPSERRGSREDLFLALKQARGLLKDLHLEILSIVAEGSDGALESAWTARLPDGKQIAARIIWLFSFVSGKIVKQHDYSTRPNDS
jgi:cation diffusion facilitator CzcD-associated flavoprotein CzcO